MKQANKCGQIDIVLMKAMKDAEDTSLQHAFRP
jgi:hypothetical protein